MHYKEPKEKSKKYKENYVNGLLNIIEQRQKEAEKIRNEYSKDIFENPEKYRNDLKMMLGWPLTDLKKSENPKVVAEKLSDEHGYTVYRMQFEIACGLKITGLFFCLDTEEKKPLVIVQHGGLGTPEFVSGFYGNTSNYNNMICRVIKQDVHVFAPQLLLWGDEYETVYDRKAIDAQLKRVGSSITAVEIFCISRIIDYFQNQKFVLSFGMVGLSYGGFYTLFTAAIDTRIKAAISCSFFNSRDNYTWSDWTWFKSAYMFDDAEIAALVYPRKLCIEVGTRDELFDCSEAVKSFDKLKSMTKSVGNEWLEDIIVFDGIHEFCKDDAPIERLTAELYRQ